MSSKFLKNHYDLAYGVPFSNFSKENIASVVSNFEARFFDGSDESPFQNKHCLDGGCGAGRGSIFMLKSGAQYVDCVDISPLNAATAKKNLKACGYENFSVWEETLTTLPFGDETFDVVWSYGVVHHTDNPSKALHELSRVLKVGGRLFLFLYGRGDLQFCMHQAIRQYLKPLTPEECFSELKNIALDINDIASCMDNWFSPFINTYTATDISKTLHNLGFEQTINFIKGGKIWDSNYRKNFIEEDKDLMGEGDLRLVCEKTQKTPENVMSIRSLDIVDNDDFTIYSKRVREIFLARIIDLLSSCSSARETVTVAHKIQRKVYDAYSKRRPIDLQRMSFE